MIIFLCDQCQKIISEAELRDGNVRKKDGEVICVDCSAGAKGREIFNCDRCQKKHSLELLRTGKALMVKGKIYCHKCREYAEKKSREIIDLKYLALIFVVFLGLPMTIGSSMWLYRYFQNISQKSDFANDNAVSKEIVLLQEQIKKVMDQMQKQNNDNTTSTKNNTFSSDSTTKKVTENSTDAETSLEKLLEDIQRKNKETSKSVNTNTNVTKNIDEKIDLLVNQISSPLSESLSSNNQGEKIQALLEIMDLREQACIPAVVNALKDEEPLIRNLAIKTLGVLGAKDVVPKLVPMVSDPDLVVRKTAAQTLSFLTGQAFKGIQDLSAEEWEKLVKFREQKNKT